MNFKAFSRNAVLPSASTSANSAGLPITDLSSAAMDRICLFVFQLHDKIQSLPTESQ
jgi:hypothetical protein